MNIQSKAKFLIQSASGQALLNDCKNQRVALYDVFYNIKKSFEQEIQLLGLTKNEEISLYVSLQDYFEDYCRVSYLKTKYNLSVLSLPTPLCKIYYLYHNESNSFRKVHRLIDLFEWAIKWHTVLVISDLLKQSELSDEMKVMFSSGLRVPSLGLWIHFFREALKTIKTSTFPWKEWENLFYLENRFHIVRFRNKLAHGATPTDEYCEQLCAKMYPVFLDLISSPIFHEIQVVYSLKDVLYKHVGFEQIPIDIQIHQKRVGVVHQAKPFELLFELWPLVTASIDPDNRPMGTQFFYFNALKNKSIEQLNYELALHYRDKSLWFDFHQVLPLETWKKISDPKLEIFRKRIESLTDIYKGRLREKEEIRNFCRTESGLFIIWGGPGIGKSALLAQVFREIRSNLDIDGNIVTDTFPDIIPYFIKRTDNSSSPITFLRNISQKLDEIYEINNLSLGNSIHECNDDLQKRISYISDLTEKNQVVLFIDGLDECLDEENPILGFIPQPNSWLKIVCSSRKTSRIETWVVDKRPSKVMNVDPLLPNDIRGILYGYVDKYSKEMTNSYIQELAKISEGNPLYVQLFCEQLRLGAYEIGRVDTLPSGISGIYKEIIKRITHQGQKKNNFNILMLLCISKDALSEKVISDFLQISQVEAESAIDECMELLFEKTHSKSTQTYQLFHESLREYLKDKYKSDYKKFKETIANICYHWKSLEEETLIYALKYATSHLKDCNDSDKVWSLLSDEDFQEMQIKKTSLLVHSFNSIKDGMYLYVHKEHKEPTDDARLCWIALQAGKVSELAYKKLIRLFDDFRNKGPESLETIFSYINLVEDQTYFLCCFLLLWSEAQRQHSLRDEDRDMSIAVHILSRLEHKIPPGTGMIDISDYLSVSFLAYWSCEVIAVWPKLNLQPILQRSSLELYDFVCSLITHLQKREKVNVDLFHYIRGLSAQLKEEQRNLVDASLRKILPDEVIINTERTLRSEITQDEIHQNKTIRQILEQCSEELSKEHVDEVFQLVHNSFTPTMMTQDDAPSKHTDILYKHIIEFLLKKNYLQTACILLEDIKDSAMQGKIYSSIFLRLSSQHDSTKIDPITNSKTPTITDRTTFYHALVNAPEKGAAFLSYINNEKEKRKALILMLFEHSNFTEPVPGFYQKLLPQIIDVKEETTRAQMYSTLLCFLSTHDEIDFLLLHKGIQNIEAPPKRTKLCLELYNHLKKSEKTELIEELFPVPPKEHKPETTAETEPPGYFLLQRVTPEMSNDEISQIISEDLAQHHTPPTVSYAMVLQRLESFERRYDFVMSLKSDFDFHICLLVFIPTIEEAVFVRKVFEQIVQTEKMQQLKKHSRTRKRYRSSRFRRNPSFNKLYTLSFTRMIELNHLEEAMNMTAHSHVKENFYEAIFEKAEQYFSMNKNNLAIPLLELVLDQNKASFLLLETDYFLEPELGYQRGIRQKDTLKRQFDTESFIEQLGILWMKSNQIDWASSLVEFITSPYTKDKYLDFLAKNFLELGDSQRAITALLDVDSNQILVEALRPLFVYYKDQIQIESALTLIEKIKIAKDQREILLQYLDKITLYSDMLRIEDFIRRIFSGKYKSNDVIVPFAKKAAQQGYMEMAIRSISYTDKYKHQEYFVELSSHIRNVESFQHYVFHKKEIQKEDSLDAILAGRFQKSGFSDFAKKLFEEAKDETQKLLIWKFIMKNVSSPQELQALHSLYVQFQDSIHWKDASIYQARAFVRLNDIEKAFSTLEESDISISMSINQLCSFLSTEEQFLYCFKQSQSKLSEAEHENTSCMLIGTYLNLFPYNQFVESMYSHISSNTKKIIVAEQIVQHLVQKEQNDTLQLFLDSEHDKYNKQYLKEKAEERAKENQKRQDIQRNTVVRIQKIFSTNGDEDIAKELCNLIDGLSLDADAIRFIDEVLQKRIFSSDFYDKFLSTYQCTLSEKEDICRSFLYYPFSKKHSFHSIYTLLFHLVENKQLQNFQEIISLCPSLHLTYLSAEREIKRRYDNYLQWIDQVEESKQLIIRELYKFSTEEKFNVMMDHMFT